MENTRIRSTSKNPTTLIVKGLNYLGIEIAKKLIEQEGYVIIIDTITDNTSQLLEEIPNKDLLTILDISAIPSLKNDLRRLDYIYYFEHDTTNFIKEISSQEFLQKSNYLDTILDLSVRFKAKFLLTTSIKAHQLLIESKNQELTGGNSLPKYSETEVQRYSENLVSEYQEKLNLDSRIIRVGELLGKGLNPSTDSYYMRLIIQAVEGKSIEIEGDGLETDFYIHYLDAARGLIHSMFSLNTKGRIYSLAVPEEISILSIAYKIGDLEPNAGEIKFVDHTNSLPPLRLYKPATNMTALGWNNKISINRSIAQSIEYVKELTVDEDHVLQNDAVNSEFEDITPEKVDAKGAIARLISERKRQEKSRIGGVVIANEELRNKVNKKQTKTKTIKNRLFWFVESFKQQFSFLKNITVTEFIFSLILLIVFGLIYVFVFAPILNVGTNIFTIYSQSRNIEDQINSYEYLEASESLDSIYNDIDDIQNRFSDISFLFSLTGQLDSYSNLQNSLQVQKDFTNGLALTYKSLDPFFNYLQGRNNELLDRLSNEESLLDVKNNNDFVDVAEISNAEASLKLGTDILRLNQDLIVDSFSIYPQTLKDLFLNKIDNLNNSTDLLVEYSENYKFIPSILGDDRQMTYLFLLQDNTEAKPSGGELASYLLFTLENGLLTDIRLNTINSIAGEIQLDNTELEEINLVSTETFLSNSVSLSDISYIKDTEIRSIVAKQYFEDQFAKRIDVIAWTNLNTIKDLLSEPLSVDDEILTSESIIDFINSNVNDQSKNERNRVISSLFSKIVTNTINEPRLITNLGLIGTSLSSNDIEIYTNDLELKTFFREYNDSLASDYVSFGITSNEDQSSNFPKIEIIGKVNVKADGSTSKDFTINPIGINNFESAWICLPSGSRNFTNPGVDNKYTSRNFSRDEACNLFIQNPNNTYPVSFETIDFETDPNSLYNYSLELVKPSGIEVNYEVEFIFETTKSVSAIGNPEIARINNFTFTGNLEENITFNFIENE